WPRRDLIEDGRGRGFRGRSSEILSFSGQVKPTLVGRLLCSSPDAGRFLKAAKPESDTGKRLSALVDLLGGRGRSSLLLGPRLAVRSVAAPDRPDGADKCASDPSGL